MKRCLTTLTVIFVCIFQANSQVVINEVSAANYSQNQDNYGQYEDWIELYNSSSTAVDLSGYYLSDRINNNTKYQMPAGCVIPASGHIVFWCSGRDNNNGNSYHTSFKLTQCNDEPAVFSDPSGNIIDFFQFTDLNTNQRNHSRGRSSDGSPDWAVFLQPTPGNTNTTQAYQEYPERPSFGQEPGFYPGAINLSITSNTPGSTIYYTLNGSTPNATSTLYTGAINITETTVVRAFAISPDPLVPSGFIETNTYFINDEFTVPVISASGDQLITLLNGQQIEPVGHFEIFDQEGLFRDEGLGEYNKHGNDSWAYPQRGLDWIMRDEFGYNNEIDYRIFRGKTRRYFQRFILKAAANCNYPFSNGGAHIRDFYVQSLSQVADMELDERSGEFCVVFANGEYWGLYDIREKVDDHDYTEYYYDQAEEDIDFLKTWGGTWEEYGSIADWVTLRNFIENNDMVDDANYAYVKTQYNTLSLIDYFIMNSYVVASDWLNWNTAWWRGRNPEGEAQQWRYILWDLDASFGHYINFTGIPNTGATADICFPEALNNPGGQGHVPIWNKLLENEDFQMEYINRLSDMSNSYFSCEFMIHHLDSLVAIMEPEMPRQIDRWGGNINTWENNMQNIYDFIETRCAVLNTNILDCYEWLDGPYEVTVDVEPAGAGTVRVNSFTPSNYPFVGQYFGGINQNYEAQANSSYEFSYWSVGDLVVTPNTDAEEITFELSQNATLVAHFEPTFLFDVTFEVIPENAGSINIDGAIQSVFPYTTELAPGQNHPLQAQAGPGYIFDKWEVSAPNMLNPNNNTEDVNLELNFTGTVKAYFYENNHTVLFDVDPPGKGYIKLDDQKIEEYPDIRELPAEFTYSLEALTDEVYYKFSHWSATHHDFEPDFASSLSSILLNQSDAITAHFVEIPNYTVTFMTNPKDVGSIRFDDQLITNFPYTERYVGEVPYALESIVPNAWEFEQWEFVMRPDLPGRIYPSLQYTPIRNDTIILHMSERFSDVFVPTAFSPNGDGVNELIKVEGLEISADEFEWVIYSRFGDLVFETNDINNAWNGSKLNSSYYCPVGVYTYLLKYKNAINNENKNKSGSIMLIR